MNILWICFVWPEPTSSAAGIRTVQLIKSCRKNGYNVEVWSPCQPNSFQNQLTANGITTKQIQPNDSIFDTEITKYNPDIVFFDRFMIEEQFSWRVRANCPEALRILDTVDLHLIRRARQKTVHSHSLNIATALSAEALNSEDAIREISAIYRSDLSLIISESEMNLLQTHYNISADLLLLCPLFYEDFSETSITVSLDFSARRNFIFIGNFNHPPNVDCVRILKKDIWGKIQARLALHEVNPREIELHVYGAYPTREILNFDDHNTGFRVKGWTADARKTLAEYKVNLAPIRFGAGIKGKITEGWAAGTPCVATSIAAEGMYPNDGSIAFGGVVTDDWEQFVQASVKFYLLPYVWNEASRQGFRLLDALFNETVISEKFLRGIFFQSTNRKMLRQKNFIGALLWHHSHRSSEYFSRWIEEKNKMATIVE